MTKSNSITHTYQPTASFRDWRLSFFWFLAAVDEDLLRRCPPPEQYKQAGIGAAILLTTVAACLSGFFAFDLLLADWPKALLVAFFWSLIIFNLDRFMVGSIRKNVNNNKLRELWVAFPRVMLATLIATLISKPIEVKIFSKQIEDVKVNMIQNAVDITIQPQIEALNLEIQRLENAKKNLGDLQKSTACQSAPGYSEEWKRYTDCQNERNKLEVQRSEIKRQQQAIRNDNRYYYLEDDGKGGTRRILNTAGDAEISRLRDRLDPLNSQIAALGCGTYRQSAERICSEYQARLGKIITIESNNVVDLDTQIKEIRQKIKDLEALKKEKATAASQDILGQLRALNRLKEKDSTMFWASWLIMLLFFILETAPIFVKILADRGSYDHLLNLKEKQIIFNSETELKEIESDAERRLRILDDEDGQLIQTEREMNESVMEKIRDAQTDIAEKVIDAWRKQEAERLENDPEQYLKNAMPKS